MIRPTNNRILVQRDEADSKSPGGIVLPDAAKKTPSRGTVVAVGPGKVLDNGTLCEVRVRPDDCVLFSQYAGTEVEDCGETYLLLSEDDILGVYVSELEPAWTPENEKAYVHTLKAKGFKTANKAHPDVFAKYKEKERK